MGDMNDNPTDESMAVYMHGKENVSEVGKMDFFSPFTSMLKAGYGSLAYRGEWNIYDIILANEALVNAPKGTLVDCSDREGQVLRTRLQPTVHGSADRAVQGYAVPDIFIRLLRRRLQRPLPDLYCH